MVLRLDDLAACRKCAARAAGLLRGQRRFAGRDSRHREQVVAARRVINEHGLIPGEAASRRLGARSGIERTPGLRAGRELRGRADERFGKRRLRRRRRHIDQRDAIGGECARRIVVRGSLPERQDGREKVDERSRMRALVGARSRHRQILDEQVGSDAEPLLHISGFGLDRERAVSRMHHGERGRRHRQHQRGRDQRFEQRKAAFAFQHHDAFRVLTLTSRASSGTRTPVAPVSGDARPPARLTRTCSTSAFEGFAGSGSIDHRRM